MSSERVSISELFYVNIQHLTVFLKKTIINKLNLRDLLFKCPFYLFVCFLWIQTCREFDPGSENMQVYEEMQTVEITDIKNFCSVIGNSTKTYLV